MDTPADSSQVVDPRYLVNLLIELQVAIRKLFLYSASHAMIPGLLENLEKHFNVLFEFVDTVTFGISRDEILYKGGSIAQNNPVIRELARGLNQLNLASITFQKGLTRNEILSFLKVVVEGRGLPPAQKERLFDQLHQEVRSIRLKTISFSGAIRSHGETSGPGEEKESIAEGRKLWRGLVNQLIEEGSQEAHQVLAEGAEGGADLAKLSGIINNLCRGQGPRSQSYEKAIVRYLHDQ